MHEHTKQSANESRQQQSPEQQNGQEQRVDAGGVTGYFASGAGSPLPLKPRQILAMQRMIGHRAVQRQLMQRTRPGMVQRDREAVDALRNQVDVYREQALGRLRRVREQSESLMAETTPTSEQIITAAQTITGDLNAWRRSVDSRALAAVETNAGDAILAGAMGGGQMIISSLADLHPATKVIWKVIEISLLVGTAVSGEMQAAENRHLLTASFEAHHLSDDEDDRIMRAILQHQRSVNKNFDRRYGDIMRLTSPEATGVAGEQDADFSRESRQLRSRDTIDSDHVEDVEDEIGQTLTIAEEAEQKLAELQQTATVVRQAPQQILANGRQGLIHIQTVFAQIGSDEVIQLQGRLVRMGPDDVVLRINPSIGSGTHQTDLHLSSTWQDFQQMGRSVSLNLNLMMMGANTGPTGGVSLLELPTSETAQVRLVSENMVEWQGAGDGVIGRIMNGPHAQVAGETAINGAVAAAVTSQDEANGRQIKEQIRTLLFSRPLSDLRFADV